MATLADDLQAWVGQTRQRIGAMALEPRVEHVGRVVQVGDGAEGGAQVDADDCHSASIPDGRAAGESGGVEGDQPVGVATDRDSEPRSGGSP